MNARSTTVSNAMVRACCTLLSVLTLFVGSQPVSASCFEAKSTGSSVCNCTSAPFSSSLCHESSVTVTKSVSTGVTVASPGLKASAGAKFSIEVSTGISGCIDTTVAPGKCVFPEYTYDCCTYWVKVPGWFFDSWKQETSCSLKQFTMHEVDAQC